MYVCHRLCKYVSKSLSKSFRNLYFLVTRSSEQFEQFLSTNLPHSEMKETVFLSLIKPHLTFNS